MLNVLFGESADNLAHIARFYCPEGVMLDATHGAGTLVKRSPIKVVGSDIDPTSKAKILADATKLSFKEDAFDSAVIDPPYLIGSKQMTMGPVGKKTWSEQRSTWEKPSDLEHFADGVARELRYVVRSKGIVIVKIMNCRHKGKLIRNDEIIARAFEDRGFALHDKIVYIRTSISSFTNNVSAVSAYGFFLIFKNVK